MPKETFYNLPESKQKTIFEAAVQEFSTQRYSDASINQIVKSAGIPRGSFYQYFNDKADLFVFVLEKITAEIKAIEQKNMADYSDCDALTQFANRLASTIELNSSRPEYTRITMIQSKESDPFVKKFFELQEEHKRAVIKLFERDKQRGLVREDVDAAAVIDMVYLLSKETFYTIGSDGNAYQKRMEAFLKIIRDGIRRS
ncbi:MAG: TetR/AcrR family transcriptional regulator [Bacillota bacterium]